eukprot:7053739-Pyramimonas_sp.AAC.1
MRTPPLGPSVELPMGPRSAVLGEGNRIRTPPLGPSVELPMGPRNAALGGGTACEHRHETLYWVGGTACEHRHWDLRWIPL